MNKIKRLCGECKHFLPDAKRTLTRYSNLPVLLGGCEVKEGRFERCGFNHNCPDFVYDRKRAESTGWAPTKESEKSTLWTTAPTKVQCLESGEVFPSIMLAAKSVNRTSSTLRRALYHTKNPGGIVRCGGLHFRLYNEEEK